MNKICTSIEQSKKLIELGIDIDTADMCYRYKWHNNNFTLLPCIDKAKEPITGDIPAWSLSALMDLMSKVNGYYPELCRGKITGEYYIWVEDTFDTQTYNNPIDAAFEMVSWLKENEKRSYENR